MKDFSADVVLHGVLQEAAIAANILGIPNILYTPLPVWDEQWIAANIMNDIPDSQATWWTNLLPKYVRRKIMKHLYERVKTKRSTIQQAAVECGWELSDGESNTSFFFRADCYLLADLSSNYRKEEFGPNVEIIGPLFAGSSERKQAQLPSQIAERLGPDKKNKVFVTLGSTGHRDHVVEAVKALCMGDGSINAIVALAPGRCGVRDIEQYLEGITIPDSVLITEDFLPARIIAPMVDVVIGHGGQGTVQTALSSGTPIVGVAMQWEQQFNLDKNAVQRGAGIRIPKRKWKANRIHSSVQKILSTGAYRDAAHRVQDEMSRTDSAKEAATVILKIAHQANAAPKKLKKHVE
jgi:UDP:flavonoid glycosyltransferase YjiC (YdhE family)